MDRRWAIAVLLGTLTVLVAPAFLGGFPDGEVHLDDRAHGCPPTLDVDPVSPEEVDERPVEFSNLPEQRQRVFERAVEGDAPELESAEAAWASDRFVHYRGTNYSTLIVVC